MANFLKGVKDEVTVPIRVELEMDMRKKQIVNFKAKYMVMTPKDAKALVKRFSEGDISEEDLLRDTLIGWSDLQGADGEDLEFSTEVFEEMLQVREYLAALINGFMESQFGREAVAAKN